jgi:Ca2+-binding RTX toxin-like protein
VDTLAINNTFVDFTVTTGRPAIANMEVLDLKLIGGGAGNTVQLNAAAVTAITGGSNALTIEGQLGDAVMLTDRNDWSATSSAGYVVLTNGSLTLNIHSSIATNVMRSSGESATLSGTGSDLVLDYSHMARGVGVNLGATSQSFDYTTAAVNTAVRDESTGNKIDTFTSAIPAWVKTGGGDDVIWGGSANNRFDLGAGNDWVVGSAGSDTILGGAGFDTVDYAGFSAAMTVDLSKGEATSSAIGTDVLFGIEQIGASSGDDLLIGDEQSNGLWGRAGADTLIGAAGADTLIGEDGSDTLMGGADHDLLVGDALSPSSGGAADKVDGGDGNDVIYGGEGHDQLWGGSGNDLIVGSGIRWI